MQHLWVGFYVPQWSIQVSERYYHSVEKNDDKKFETMTSDPFSTVIKFAQGTNTIPLQL